MAIDKFKIVNEDGSTNQSEYNRCINFLNNYIDGKITVTPETTWENPFEVDMTQNKSAFEMLQDILSLNENRLLTKKAYDHIKDLFKGLLDYYGAGIYTCGNYITQSKNFLDGPGYMYDPLTGDETEVQRNLLSGELAVYFKNDKYKTVVGYEDVNYIPFTDSKQITWNIPIYSPNIVRHYQSNVDNHPNVYKGYVSGVYTPFYRLCGQYVGSSTLFNYSQCNDLLYTSNMTTYDDSRINEPVVVRTKGIISNFAQPARGIDLSLVTTAQSSIQNPTDVNAYLDPAVTNSVIPYINPTDMTAADQSEWISNNET